MLSAKEKKEIGIIAGSVLFVVVIGLVLVTTTSNKVDTIAGAAIKLNPDVPTLPGTLVLLKDYCGPVTGDGDCNEICGERTCFPIEENCDFPKDNNQCMCCSSP